MMRKMQLLVYLWCNDCFCHLVAVDTSADIQKETNLVPFVPISPKEKAPLNEVVKVLLESNSVSAGGLVVSARAG